MTQHPRMTAHHSRPAKAKEKANLKEVPRDVGHVVAQSTCSANAPTITTCRKLRGMDGTRSKASKEQKEKAKAMGKAKEKAKAKLTPT